MLGNISFFGPHVQAEVRIDVNNKVQDILIRNPIHPGMLCIPAEWASEVAGSMAEIIDQVSKSLSGAQVTIVRIMPVSV